MNWFRRTLHTRLLTTGRAKAWRAATGLVATGLVATLALSGCALFRSHEFVLPDTMPSDFFLGVQVREATQPPIDYIVKIARSGKIEYDTTIRAPRRREFTGEAELSETEVLGLYDAVLAAEFDLLDDTYDADGGATSDVSRGVRSFYVYSAATEKRIDVNLVSVPQLDGLQARIIEVLPKQVLDATAKPEIDRTNPSVFVVDTATMAFHLTGCERAKAIAPGNRKEFESQYQALDFGYHPCPVCDPLNVKR